MESTASTTSERWCWVFTPVVFSTAPWYDKKYMVIVGRNYEADGLKVFSAKFMGQDVPVYTHKECEPNVALGGQCYKKFKPPYACTCCQTLTMPDGKLVGYRQRRFQLTNYEGADESVISKVEEYTKLEHETLVEKCQYNEYFNGVEKTTLKGTIEVARFPVGTCVVADVTEYDRTRMLSGYGPHEF